MNHLRRRLYIGRPEYLSAQPVPMYRELQLLELDLKTVNHMIYPTGLAAYSSLCIPLLIEVEAEIQKFVDGAAGIALIEPVTLGLDLARSLRSIRKYQELKVETLRSLGTYARATYRYRNALS